MELLCAQLEHEVVGEAFRVAANREVQLFRLDLVELRQMSVQHHLLPANEQNASFDALGRDAGF